MGKFKIVLSILVIGLMAFSLSACGKSDKMVTGVVKDATMSTITIETQEGQMLFFSVEGVDISQAEGVTIGDNVEIYYTGEIKNGSTADAQVIKVVKIIKDVPTPEQSSDTPEVSGDEDINFSTVEGVVTDATRSTITIKTADEETLNFTIDDAEKVSLNGFSLGETVKITYSGEIEATDTSAANVVKVEQISEAK